jgi:2-C-methyl-D-erythritol 2,4-cyclodiphosphate synthase
MKGLPEMEPVPDKDSPKKSTNAEAGLRIGIGYDIHRLVAGRKLILGGVTIPFEKGLLGHSDADALVHALIDALLGAAGLGDIGRHFPDSDPEFKDACSLDLLKTTCEMIRNRGFQPLNMDATIFAETPKLVPYNEKMSAGIAGAMDLEISRINIKATTTEGLGPVGRGEGIAAMCVVLITTI